MLGLPRSVRIYFAAELTDMRKGMCSTPEGIEAGGTRLALVPHARMAVLNARGHRSGRNQRLGARRRDHLGQVLNARGHRSGRNIRDRDAGRDSTRCSTPEGIEAGGTGGGCGAS